MFSVIQLEIKFVKYKINNLNLYCSIILYQEFDLKIGVEDKEMDGESLYNWFICLFSKRLLRVKSFFVVGCEIIGVRIKNWCL